MKVRPLIPFSSFPSYLLSFFTFLVFPSLFKFPPFQSLSSLSCPFVLPIPIIPFKFPFSLYPFLSFSFQPFLRSLLSFFYLFLSFPQLPIQSYPILSYPILSYHILSISFHFLSLTLLSARSYSYPLYLH